MDKSQQIKNCEACNSTGINPYSKQQCLCCNGKGVVSIQEFSCYTCDLKDSCLYKYDFYNHGPNCLIDYHIVQHNAGRN